MHGFHMCGCHARASPQVVIEPLGSYRRGKPDSGDADILLSHRTELVTGPDCRCRIACSCTGLHGQVRV